MDKLTLQELLSIDKIVDMIKDKSPQDQILLLAELKEQARGYNITRSHNEIVKAAKDKIAIDRIASQRGKKIKDPPEEIKDFAGYHITELGIFMQLNHTLFEVCPYPIFITERYTDIDDGTEKVKLKFKRDGMWHEIVLPRAIVANSTKIIQLADNATGITSENAKAVVKYLSDVESANRYTIPIKRSVSRLGWTEDGFVPFIDDIEYTGADTYAQLYKKFHEQGDFLTWRDLCTDCIKYTIPKIILAASYASLLLKQIGVNGFCVHLWGESGRGKTVALMLAASIYGDADPKAGIIRNGKTTSNGIEPVLAFFNDCAVCFDEFTTLTQEQITDMVYKFAQGQGKGRMTKNAGLQRSYTWNNVAILSAEKPLFDSRTQSGAVNRVISIYTEGAVFGDMDMVEIANTLKANYGFGAKLFIDAISNGAVDVAKIFSRHLNEIDPDIEQKQANAAAVILTAYEIAARYVYGINDKLTAEDLLPFLAKKTDVSISSRAYENLLAWVEANYTFFDDSIIPQSKWGAYAKKSPVVHIFYTRFSEWCQKNGYQEVALLREWRNKGLIKTRNKNELKNNAKINEKLYSDVISVVIAVKGSDSLVKGLDGIVKGSDEENMQTSMNHLIAIDDDEPLPF